MSDNTRFMLSDHNLGLDLMRATESAALAAVRWVGRGEKESGDKAAVDAMRSILNQVGMQGIIVIGEGEKDEAPMLANGEKVGTGWGQRIDIAVDPVDGTRLLARGSRNAIAVLAASEGGTMYDPHMCFYMDKLVAGADCADVIEFDAPIGENIRKVAKALNKPVDQVTVAVLNRERHNDLVKEIREAGASTRMFTDGDVAAGILAATPGMRIDLMAGIGGSPEGVVLACALKCLGGRILAKLEPTTEEERQRTIDAGFDPEQVLDTDDLVKSNDTIFVATGITDGNLVDGVRVMPDGSARTNSVVMRSRSGTVRYVEAYHRLDKINAWDQGSRD
ncbi:MAG: fructose-bisphosphatase class II [Propionibacterium sp.]|nr:MAG: fructose-bisphosphatase class II [Propionibacterium sp.]